jgi:alpha-ketoglutarate-dependent taurine dioxygenase
MRLQMAASDVDLPGDAIAESLASEGLVMIHEASVDELRDFLADWTVPVRHPHERAPGLTIVSPRSDVPDAADMAGFGRSGLIPHTDRSLEPDPPSLLAVVMVLPGSSGGDSSLVDGAHLVATLCQSFGRDAVGSLRLRTRMGTTVPVVESVEGLARIRFRSDLLASLYSESGNYPVLKAWRELVSQPTLVRLGAGDGYLVHNHRYLHGRSNFEGPRRLVRVLARVDDGHRLAWLNKGFRVASA